MERGENDGRKPGESRDKNKTDYNLMAALTSILDLFPRLKTFILAITSVL